MHVDVPSLPAASMELQKLLALVDSEGHRTKHQGMMLNGLDSHVRGGRVNFCVLRDKINL